MRKVFFLLLVVSSFSLPCIAKDHSDNILSLLSLPKETVTREKIVAIFGKPVSVEENNKKEWWHYTNEGINLVFCWNKKNNQFENFSFKNEMPEKTVCDGQVCRKLQSGSTDISQAIKLLGTPADMKIKNATQELHYTYQNVVMRLFFRNRILVDFTLLTQMNN